MKLKSCYYCECDFYTDTNDLYCEECKELIKYEVTIAEQQDIN